MNLKSDLSWYGNKPGFAKKAEDIASRKTDYVYNDNLTVRTNVTGYDNNGFVSQFTPRFSADAFVIDDTSHSFRGTSSRKTQQGGGSKFPIGPKGQIHDFDIPRLGFHIDNRYGNTYNAKSLSGLAATYTKNSPIDDVYNIVKVRDVSYDPFGYASPPYILRGIQRDDNRYPQRWGTGNQIADTVSLALGVPRGGALAFGERAANDVARLAKMLIRPMGLGWISKQALLHLMNPNTEGVTGYIQPLNNHKVSSPLNTLLAAGVSGLGLHPRKYGLLPIGNANRYEDIIINRNILSLGDRWNRLNRLLKEQNFDYSIGSPGYLLSTISGPTGPNSIGGIGFTNFSKSRPTIPTTPERLLAMPGKDGKGITNYNRTPGGLAPLQSINSLTPATVVRDSISRYGSLPFAKGEEETLGQIRPLVYAYTYGQLSQYGVSYLRELHRNTGTDAAKTIIYSAGTRPEVSNAWQIRIPINVNIRSSDAPVSTYSTFTLEKLLAQSQYFRSYLNPYNSKNAGVGYKQPDGKSFLEAKYPDGSTTLPLKNNADETNRTDGVDSDGITLLTGIRKYKAMARPMISRISGNRTPGQTDSVIDFTTGAAWTAADSPMNKIGKIGGADSPRSKTWDTLDASDDTINISIGGQIFPAYLTDLSTKADQGLLTFKPAGSPVAVLAGSNDFTTGVGISFIVAARSRAEFDTLWASLKLLQGKVKPTASGGVWSPTKCPLKVGNFVNITNSYLTSIGLGFDNEYPWELDAGSQNPIYITVDCQLSVINGTGVYG